MSAHLLAELPAHLGVDRADSGDVERDVAADPDRLGGIRAMKPLVETSQTVTSMLYQLCARSWVRPATGVRPDLRGLILVHRSADPGAR